jgi:hypothetical protein
MAGLDYRGYWFAGRRFGPDGEVNPHPGARDHDLNLLFRPNGAPSFNLPPLGGAADLDAGVPILVSFGSR